MTVQVQQHPHSEETSTQVAGTKLRGTIRATALWIVVVGLAAFVLVTRLPVQYQQYRYPDAASTLR